MLMLGVGVGVGVGKHLECDHEYLYATEIAFPGIDNYMMSDEFVVKDEHYYVEEKHRLHFQLDLSVQ